MCSYTRLLLLSYSIYVTTGRSLYCEAVLLNKKKGGASLDRKCDSHQGRVKGIKNECHLMERCDGHGVGARGWKGGMVIMEV